MRFRSLTEIEKQYIDDNYSKLSIKDIAKNLKLFIYQVRIYIRVNKLDVKQTPFALLQELSASDKAFIIKNYRDMSVHKMAKLLKNNMFNVHAYMKEEHLYGKIKKAKQTVEVKEEKPKMQRPPAVYSNPQYS